MGFGIEFMKKLVRFILFVSLIGVAHAQQEGIQVGSATLFPTVGLSFGYDDNVFYTSDEQNELSSNFTVFSPGIRLEAEGERTDFLAQYDYNKTSYNGASEYDFEMHHVLASLGYNASSRSRVGISTEYFNGSDRIGTANRQGDFINLGLAPDEWNSFGLGAKWHYGGIGAKGAIDLEVGTINRQYTNNREFTSTRDRRTNYLGATYSHTISPKTNFLTQFKRTNIDYDTATLDNSETRLMLGAEWKATGKTSARALVGYLTKDFVDPQHGDFNGLAVEAGATWSPKSYSIFDLTLARETDETNGNGSYVVRNSADIGWTHFWKDRFSTTANLGLSKEDYRGSLRNDDVNYYGLSAKYQFRDWLMSGLGYKHINRDSTLNDFSYKDNSLLLSIELSK